MVDLRACITAVLLFGISSLYQKQKKKKISPVLLISISALLGILIF
jgi:TctA family transporter